MNHIKNLLKSKILVLTIVSFFLKGCIDPVEPEFNYQEGLIYIEGFVSTTPGASFVSVYESIIEFGVYQNVFLKGATVSLRNTETDVIVDLEEQEDAYLPPSDFKASVGESWEMYLTLADGRQYQSVAEKINTSVAISSIEADYDPELFFSEAKGDFIPGHSVSVSFNDPSNEANYYYWRYRSYEPIIDCEICYDGLFRNGGCESAQIGSEYYTYACLTSCFRIRYNETIQIFADEFVNGRSLNKLPVGNVPLYTKKNVLVEIEQLSLSPAAHKYYMALKDIIDNNGGFNAPPPAALIGNIFNPNNSEEYVLGRVTASASSTASIFIDRSGIEERQLETVTPSKYEPYGAVPDPQTTVAPCEETRYRTGIAPQDWID